MRNATLKAQDAVLRRANRGSIRVSRLASFGFCYRLLADKVGCIVGIAAALIVGFVGIGA
jgi:hypothetical protein